MCTKCMYVMRLHDGVYMYAIKLEREISFGKSKYGMDAEANS